MDQTFDALLNFNERTVVGDVRDLAEQTRTRRVAARDADPRIFAELLEAQRDAVLLGVELQDLGGDFVADLNHFGRVTDTAPGQVGDVQQAIDAAEVDERTVVGDVLDDALDDGAFLQRREQLFALFAHGSLEHGAARNNDVVALAVELDDLEFEFLAFVRRGVLDRTHVDERTRQECADAVRHDGQTTLDLAGDNALDQGTVVQSTFKEVPGSDALGLVARQTGFAETVFQRFDCDLDVIARLHFDFATIIAELVDRNVGLGLEAGVNDDEVLIHAHDFGSDDLTDAHFLAAEALFKERGKAFLGGNRSRHVKGT